MDKNFEVDEEVYFQAYVDNEPVPCIIKRKGTLDELDKNWFNISSKVIYYEAESKINNSMIYLTSANNLFIEKPWYIKKLT